ncbi:PREDICTED: transcription termination factor MTERF8, chloroplastic isoform X1 [Theobroma cacao]|uniref:Transcription termination factor MTERF8, chloroplastic isoform X1 n=1 Tax=Theobroma cacao TaxID=3641 RepID=A0AB32VAT4_THECC|nr:PREDICTED: transcription termination factor MTERF8, chloroplastic isoform X1 [Theobroma cacao]
MFYFLCKRILHGRLAVTASQSHKVLCVSKNDPSSLSSSLLGVSASLTLRCISSSSKKQSFTVSYLKKKCGLSSESALTAAKYVQFKTSDRADTVIAFFKNHGFSEPQITRLIKRRPVVLVSDVETTLLPKLEFFRSKGISSPDLVKILSDNPTILGSSLEKQIIPSFNCLSNFLSEEKIIDAVKRYPRLLSYDLNAVLLPNINLLLDNGVPECNIVTTLHSLPSTLMRGPIQFKDMVDGAKDMGFIPSRPMFMVALFAMSSMSKSTWKKKFEVFKKFGWSEKEAFEAFRRYPTFVRVSEDKFMAVMDFLVNKMGFQSLLIAKRPRILMMSLDKKIVPRGLYAQDLLSKGLIRHVNLQALLETSDDLFVEKFVNRFKAEASELLKLYQEKLNHSKNWKIG